MWVKFWVSEGMSSRRKVKIRMIRQLSRPKLRLRRKQKHKQQLKLKPAEMRRNAAKRKRLRPAKDEKPRKRQIESKRSVRNSKDKNRTVLGSSRLWSDRRTNDARKQPSRRH